MTYNDLLARVYNKEHFMSMKICDSLLLVVRTILMIGEEQDLLAIVTLSAAKGLARWIDASLRSA